jgi:Domain of unknown function (DUF4411)
MQDSLFDQSDIEVVAAPPPEIYLIDSCSVIRLDGKDRNPPAQPFTTVERELIWEGLEAFAENGRLKIIKEVREEVERLDPLGLDRLKQHSAHRLIIRRTQKVITQYQAITANHPDLMKGGSRFNPADPWLILAVEKYDYRIITEELLKSARTTQVSRMQRRERIPDVCQARTLKAPICLRDLAVQEGWIT